MFKGGERKGILFSRCPPIRLSDCPCVRYVLVSASYLLNDLRNVFILCINIDVDKMLLLDKNQEFGVNYYRVFPFVILEKTFWFLLLTLLSFFFRKSF